jgi:hypothetical protein
MTVTDPTQMFHMALDDAGIPIDGVGIVDPNEENPPGGHIVTRDDGLVVNIGYRPEATPEQITEGDNIVMTLDISPKRVRTAWDILADISALSNKQKDNIATDLKAGNSAKIKSLGPPYEGIMMALDWAAITGTVIQTRDAYCRLAAMYTQQNIYYLETPAFDPTINISGWEVIPPADIRRFTVEMPRNLGAGAPGPGLPGPAPRPG